MAGQEARLTRTWPQFLADIGIAFLCLLRLLALWVLFLTLYGSVTMLKFLKRAAKSKTMWLAAIVAGLPAIPGVIEAAAPLLGENAVQKASAVVGVLIALSRVVTRVPLEAKDAPK